jgi:hypothetical protein
MPKAIFRGFRRHPVVIVNAVLLLVVGTAGIWRGTELLLPSSRTPADLFMQSIATEDGDLGWNQLCPTLQEQLPRDVLQQLTMSQRTIASEQGLTLKVEHVGDRPRPTGGEIRFYVATLRTADGSTGQKTYIITTQESGCVEAVQ